jgi:hypothetical protein
MINQKIKHGGDSMKYYPIGTVVKLINGNKPIMIYGRRQIQMPQKKEWDYVACLYPEGKINDDHTIFFHHEEISEVKHMGYKSQEEERMQRLLNEA